MDVDNSEVYQKYNAHAEEYNSVRLDPSKMWFNAFMDNPSVLATLKAIGVDGKDVLDIGCGSGIFTAQVRDIGAKVAGSDLSDKFIDIARRNYPDIDFRVYDAYKMGFEDKSFDVVCSTLMAHYFEDLTNLFKEVHRVLRPNGDYVFSITHPTNAVWYNSWGKLINGKESITMDPYFVENKKHTWALYDGERQIFNNMPFYRHNIEDITTALDVSGFYTKRMKEPRPIPSGKEVNPTLYTIFMKFPTFLTVHAIKK